MREAEQQELIAFNHERAFMNQSIISVILLIAYLLIAPLATASEADFQQGKQAYLKKDYATAFTAFKKAADKNHAGALYWLGTMYQSNKFGLEADQKKMYALIQRAADNGHASAAYSIAQRKASDIELLFDNTDLSDAILLYEKAAKLGHVKAQKWLADVHAPKRKFHGDIKKHIHWIQKSAQGGDREAQFTLSEAHMQGVVVNKSKKEAFKWLEQSAKRGHVKAQIEIGKVYLSGFLEKEKNPKLAMEWLKLAGRNGSGEAIMVLGMILIIGEDVEKKPELGLNLLKEAAKKGHVPAMFKIGELYALGITGKPEIIKSLTWINVAGLKGHPNADKAKAVIKRKHGYGPAELTKAKLRAENCIATNYTRCNYDSRKLTNYNQKLLDDVTQRAKERSQQQTPRH